MKKLFYSIATLLVICSLVACQKNFSLEKSGTTYGSSGAPSSSINSLIGSPLTIDDFPNDIVFSLNTPTISKAQAENLVNNDISQFPREQSLHRKTAITSNKKESHVMVNRRPTSTYSIKDLIEEKHTITQIDSDRKWEYIRNVEDTTTVYFAEGTIYRHFIVEQLFFVKDDYEYRVFANQCYYEGTEGDDTFNAYYYKKPVSQESSHDFRINLQDYTYFYSRPCFDKIEKSVKSNFNNSSSFYRSRNLTKERNPIYEYHTSGEKGDFGCVAADDYTYRFSDLNDYPHDEESVLHTINYHQDYLLNISNYFTYDEDFLTKSISKSADGTVIRDETMQGRKKIFEECEVFYPDLSRIQEKQSDSSATK